jgi:hypothetical protein
MEGIALAVIKEWETRDRPIITCDVVLQRLLRGTDNTPDLICGWCRHVLTSGISLSRFMTIDDVVNSEARAFALDAGTLVVEDTIKLSDGVYVAGIQKPVLKCPACNAFNDPSI